MSEKAKKYLDNFDNHPPEEFADFTDGLVVYTERQVLHYMQGFADEEVNKFISSLNNNAYNFIRNSKGDAECRRYLRTLKQLEK